MRHRSRAHDRQPSLRRRRSSARLHRAVAAAPARASSARPQRLAAGLEFIQLRRAACSGYAKGNHRPGRVAPDPRDDRARTGRQLSTELTSACLTRTGARPSSASSAQHALRSPDFASSSILSTAAGSVRASAFTRRIHPGTDPGPATHCSGIHWWPARARRRAAILPRARRARALASSAAPSIPPFSRSRRRARERLRLGGLDDRSGRAGRRCDRSRRRRARRPERGRQPPAGSAQPLTISGSGAFNFAPGEGTFALSDIGPASRRTGGAARLLAADERDHEAGFDLRQLAAVRRPPARRRALAEARPRAGRAGDWASTRARSPAAPTRRSTSSDLRAAGGKRDVVGHEAVRGVLDDPLRRHDRPRQGRRSAGREPRAQARAECRSSIEATRPVERAVDVCVHGRGLVRSIGLVTSRAEHPAAARVTPTAARPNYFDFGAVARPSRPPPERKSSTSPRQALQGLGAGG